MRLSFKFIIRWPFLIWAIIAYPLVLHFVNSGRYSFDGGTLLDLFAVSWGLWGFMFYIPHELLFDRGLSIEDHEKWSIIYGFLIVVLLDLMVNCLRLVFKRLFSDN